ncbi:OadG family protein [Alteromonas gilva]|uniref:Probable oxaloacetate decarboxylase gamma chain n=1 Tax=Alteromonas gilva TaxID=2987522 RepID=A0ABT5L3S7_9ALTE|nr:OadG family transporter subunit [Alteromonas gilva]MDC8831695.1 OadG family transporter subunit [Alteromonas gilva]
MATSISELLVEAGNLLLVGMGFVFVFLTILIFAVNGLKAFCERFPGAQPQAPVRASGNKAKQAPSTDNNVIAAISAAVHAHRNANK